METPTEDAAAGRKNGRATEKYRHLHRPVGAEGLRDAVIFDMARGNPRTEAAARQNGDPATAQVIVTPSAVTRLPDLARRISETTALATEPQIRAILASLVEAVTDELRCGHRVILDGLLSLGVSIPGRHDPAKPWLVPRCDIRPQCRFAPSVTRRINDGARIAYLHGRLPTAVQVTAVTPCPGSVLVDGNFQGADGIEADIAPDGRDAVPCTVSLLRPDGSTRPSAHTLELRPARKLPLGAARLTLRWLDGAQVPCATVIPLVITARPASVPVPPDGIPSP